MLRSTILGLAATLALALSTSAQTPLPFPVTSSGCANAVAISGTGLSGGGTTVKIGTTVSLTATWPTSPGLAATVILLGWPSGSLVDWSAILPFCTPGPCTMYLVPYSGVPYAYDLLAGVGDSLTLTLPIPNSVSLVQNGVSLGVQALHADFVGSCWDMSLAYNRPLVIN